MSGPLDLKNKRENMAVETLIENVPGSSIKYTGKPPRIEPINTTTRINGTITERLGK